MNQLKHAEQPLRAQAERVAVAEENFLRRAAEVLHSQQLCLDIFERELTEFQMLEERAEAACVIGTADSDRQHEPAYLHRRFAYLSFIIHRQPLFLIAFIVAGRVSASQRRGTKILKNFTKSGGPENARRFARIPRPP